MPFLVIYTDFTKKNSLHEQHISCIINSATGRYAALRILLNAYRLAPNVLHSPEGEDGTCDQWNKLSWYDGTTRNPPKSKIDAETIGMQERDMFHCMYLTINAAAVYFRDVPWP